MTTRKKETLKKIIEKNIKFGRKINTINIYNLEQGTTGETFIAIIEYEGIKVEYELLHQFRHRDVIIKNYKIIKY